MHAFKYHRPSSLNDAAALAKGEAKLLAGGQTLVQTMKLRLASPTDIIDLGTIKDLAGIKSDGKSVTIGAMTRHAEVALSADVKKAIPALAGPGGEEPVEDVAVGGKARRAEERGDGRHADREPESPAEHLLEHGGGNYLLPAFPGLIVKDSYWRWPERDLAGNAIDFHVQVLGLADAVHLVGQSGDVMPLERAVNHHPRGMDPQRILQSIQSGLIDFFRRLEIRVDLRLGLNVDALPDHADAHDRGDQRQGQGHQARLGGDRFHLRSFRSFRRVLLR